MIKHYLSNLKRTRQELNAAKLAANLKAKVKEFINEEIKKLPDHEKIHYNNGQFLYTSNNISRYAELRCDVSINEFTESIHSNVDETFPKTSLMSENKTKFEDLNFELGADKDYITQIVAHVSNTTVFELIRSTSIEDLDHIEDQIINHGKIYCRCAAPIHGVNVRFLPRVNAISLRCGIKSVEQLLSSQNVLKVGYTAREQDYSGPGLTNFLFEIGKVAYTKECKQSPLLADKTGKIYSYAIGREGKPYHIRREYDPQYWHRTASGRFIKSDQQTKENMEIRTYTDGYGNQKPVTEANYYYEETDNELIFGSTEINNDYLLLIDVTEQVLPLIKPKSRVHKFITRG